MLVNNLPKRSM